MAVAEKMRSHYGSKWCEKLRRSFWPLPPWREGLRFSFGDALWSGMSQRFHRRLNRSIKRQNWISDEAKWSEGECGFSPRESWRDNACEWPMTRCHIWSIFLHAVLLTSSDREIHFISTLLSSHWRMLGFHGPNKNLLTMIFVLLNFMQGHWMYFWV